MAAKVVLYKLMASRSFAALGLNSCNARKCATLGLVIVGRTPVSIKKHICNQVC